MTVMVDVDYLIVGDDARIQCVRETEGSLARRFDLHRRRTDQPLTADLVDRDGFLLRAMSTRWHETFGKRGAAK